MWLFKILFGVGRFFSSILTGGSLENILKTIDRELDDGAEKERVKAEVTKKIVDRQADLLVGRTWWFQLFFVVPLGVWWTSVILDSVNPFGWFTNHVTHALPSPLDEWAAWIISALFIVDGTKAVIGRFTK